MMSIVPIIAADSACMIGTQYFALPLVAGSFLREHGVAMSASELRSSFNSSSSGKIWVGCPITSHMAQTSDSHCVVGFSSFFRLLFIFLAVIIGFAMGTSFAGMFSTIS